MFDVHLNMFVLVLEIVVGVVLAFIYIKARIPKETIKQQGELITALQQRQIQLDDENSKLRSDHIENQKAIAALQGQIKVYKELPLKEIAASLKMLEEMPKQFEKIQAQNTKVIVDSVNNVKVQNVEQQNVKTENVENKE